MFAPQHGKAEQKQFNQTVTFIFAILLMHHEPHRAIRHSSLKALLTILSYVPSNFVGSSHNPDCVCRKHQVHD